MLFSSITFLGFFLPFILVLYYSIPNRIYRNCVLFLGSLLFYAWGEPKFIFLMFASIIFNYNMGLRLGNPELTRRKTLLIISIIVNIGILFVFKYLGFSCRIVTAILTSLHLKPLRIINLIMPIGISFYTFQEISYIVDVYRNPELSQKNLLNLGLYISFFPQLIAGPIVRYHDINEQIIERTENLSQFANGIERFIIGLSKKLLIANAMAQVCDKIYSADFFSYGTYAAWIAAIAYALQIYYDFSGYSDMAIGLAKMFGFDLLENFNYPYAASSITDFWKRWHISLTNFFRDYVYIPLGGNRKGSKRTVLNRYIVFFTTGLWHGASFSFILWGLAHGTLMTIERLFGKNVKISECKILRILLSIFHRVVTILFILLLWILFRNGTKMTLKLLFKMAGVNYTIFTSAGLTRWFQVGFLYLGIDIKFYILASMGIIFCFPWWKKIRLFYSENNVISMVLRSIKYLMLVCLLVLCFANLASNSYNPFIYFRF